ncbi:hypothetical protein GCM10027098_36740 [Bowmanella dokdonensis]
MGVPEFHAFLHPLLGQKQRIVLMPGFGLPGQLNGLIRYPVSKQLVNSLWSNPCSLTISSINCVTAASGEAAREDALKVNNEARALWPIHLKNGFLCIGYPTAVKGKGIPLWLSYEQLNQSRILSFQA